MLLETMYVLRDYDHARELFPATLVEVLKRSAEPKDTGGTFWVGQEQDTVDRLWGLERESKVLLGEFPFPLLLVSLFVIFIPPTQRA